MPYDRYALLDRHGKYLDRLRHRCQLTGKLIGKQVMGVYQPYNFHHVSSDAYGHEKPGFNYLLLTPRAHWLVHFLGGVIVPGKSITIQNRRAKRLPFSNIWKFPNPLQRLFHWYCRVPIPIRRTIFVVSVCYLVVQLTE